MQARNTFAMYKHNISIWHLLSAILIICLLFIYNAMCFIRLNNVLEKPYRINFIVIETNVQS